MKIQTLNFYRNAHSPEVHNIPRTDFNYNTKVTFGSAQILTHVNIGNCPQGFIGKIKSALSNNEECILNVFKRFSGFDEEEYLIKNDYDELIGKMILKVKKYFPGQYDPLTYKEDPSHVFIDELKNYTKPNTPIYNGITPHKHIGTRLLQIAQRRSDEAQCLGNIQLTAKNESKNWYKDFIGLKETPAIMVGRFRINSANELYLPNENKERLSRLWGGL